MKIALWAAVSVVSAVSDFPLLILQDQKLNLML
jgi:hypothetical protein